MSLRWRLGAVIGLTVICAFVVAANFVPEDVRKGAWWLPDDALRLGLDLRGGIHMVLGPDLAAAVGHELSAMRSRIEGQLEDAEVTGVRMVVEADVLRILPSNAEDAAKVRELVEDDQGLVLSPAGEYDIEARLTADARVYVRDRAIAQVLEVLRNRINDPQTGIPESVVTKQGVDRILVQIPGVSRVPDIFRTTGFLEFKIVQDEAASEALLREKYSEGLPEGTQIAVERDPATDRVLKAYLVPTEAAITGDYLENAQVGFDNRRNERVVSFLWNAEGARIFGKVTEENLQKKLAIILDGEIKSAPVIQSRIGRQGQITGRFTAEDAKDLAIVLRAGALPISVEIEEERTIGPALGADSIAAGLRAAIVGLLVVVAFTVGYYRMSGGYASIALLVNLVMIVALMSVFRGTLTLPGIAGLVLTVGMAVDANVIIFERIREELRAGRAPRAAVATGFQKARWTILDANITTLITAIILYNYGTGPIKGFAVTLSVGIVTSVFAALVVTRLLFEWWPGNRPIETLSI